MEGGRYSVKSLVIKFTSVKTKPANRKDLEKYVQDLYLESVEGVESGCMGNCGSGPNLSILPKEVFYSHVQTVAQMTDILKAECGAAIDDDFMTTTQLRMAGNAAARSGDLATAEERFSTALDLNVALNRHLLLANRSGIRLGKGNVDGALSDAQAAIDCAPLSFTTGNLRLIDVYYLRQDYRKAKQCLEDLVVRNPEFRMTEDYRVISQQLDTVLGTKRMQSL